MSKNFLYANELVTGLSHTVYPYYRFDGTYCFLDQANRNQDRLIRAFPEIMPTVNLQSSTVLWTL